MNSARFIPRLALVILFLAPLAYFGALLAILVHEFFGHGCVAWALGGEFNGFIVRWNVSGFALAAPAMQSPPSHSLAISAGGMTSTIILGAIMLILVWREHHRPFLRITLAMLAACFTLCGSLYLLWNAYLPNPPGDFSGVMEMANSQTLRWTCVVIGAALTIIFYLAPMAIVINESNRYLARDMTLTRTQRAIMPLIITVAFGMGQFINDWHPIIHDIGRVPNIAGIALALLLIPVLMLLPADTRPLHLSHSGIFKPLIAAWTAMAAMALTMGLWLNEGIMWQTP